MSCIFVIGHRSLWYMPKLVQLGHVIVLLLVFEESYTLHSGRPGFYSLHQCSSFPHPHQCLLKRHLTVDPGKWECLQESHSGRRKSTCHRGTCSPETDLQLRPLHRMWLKPDNEMVSGGQVCWPGTAWMCKPLSPSKDGWRQHSKSLCPSSHVVALNKPHFSGFYY